MTEVLKKLGEKYLTSQRNSATEKEKLTNHPAYIVVYLVHVLAHLEDFPSDDSLDEGAYAEFSRYLFIFIFFHFVYFVTFSSFSIVQFEVHVSAS